MDKGRKMDKKILAIELAVLLLVIGLLSGCAGNPFDPSAKFVGTWKDDSGMVTIVFFSDKTVNSPITTEYGTYEIKDGKLVMTGAEGESVYDYSFSNDDTTLTLVPLLVTMGQLVLTKQ